MMKYTNAGSIAETRILRRTCGVTVNIIEIWIWDNILKKIETVLTTYYVCEVDGDDG